MSGDGADRVVDVFALRADDALLDRLGARQGAPTALAERGELFPGSSSPARSVHLAKGPVEELLTAWRAEITGPDLPPLPSVGKADWALRRGQRRSIRPMIGVAAAICALLLGSAGVGSRLAGPNDLLWGLSQVLWSDHAHSAQASYNVQVALVKASDALKSGDVSVARSALMEASGQMALVQPSDDKKALEQAFDQLNEQVSPGTSETSTTGTTANGGVLGTTTPSSRPDGSQLADPPLTFITMPPAAGSSEPAPVVEPTEPGSPTTPGHPVPPTHPNPTSPPTTGAPTTPVPVTSPADPVTPTTDNGGGSTVISQPPVTVPPDTPTVDPTPTPTDPTVDPSTDPSPTVVTDTTPTDPPTSSSTDESTSDSTDVSGTDQSGNSAQSVGSASTTTSSTDASVENTDQTTTDGQADTGSTTG